MLRKLPPLFFASLDVEKTLGSSRPRLCINSKLKKLNRNLKIPLDKGFFGGIIKAIYEHMFK